MANDPENIEMRTMGGNAVGGSLELTSREEAEEKAKLHAPGPAHEVKPEEEGRIEKAFAPPLPPFAFWFQGVLVAILGAVLGLFAVGYVKAINEIPSFWYTADNGDFPDDSSRLSWVQGKGWWVAVGTAAGVFSGTVKAIFNKEEYPPFITELRERHVNPLESLQVLALGLAALFAGAPVGPESGMGATGCMFGYVFAWALHKVIKSGPLHDCISSPIFTFVGGVAALAPFLPNPFVSMILCAELAGPIGRTKEWEYRSPMQVYTLMSVAATASFAVYYAITPEPFLDPGAAVYLLDQTTNITSWDFAIGILFGFMGSILGLCFFLIAAIVKVVFRLLSVVLDRLVGRRARLFVNCVIGGSLFGLFNFLFPLTLGPGDEMITPIIKGTQDGTLSSGLLVSSAFIKMLSYWITVSSGMVGGIFFPTLITGLMWGEAFRIWTGVNEVVAISCSFVALPASFIPIPTTLIMLSFLSFVIGPQGMFPIFTTTITSYLFFTGIGIPQALLNLKKNQPGNDKDEEES